MLSRFSPLKRIAASLSKLVTTRKTTPAPNLLLHTSACHRQIQATDPDTYPRKVAVVLCGCGKHDGTTVCEAVSVAIKLYEAKFEPVFFAPNDYILFGFDHWNMTYNYDLNEARHAMDEAARMILPNHVYPLADADPAPFEALIIPGSIFYSHIVACWRVEFRPHAVNYRLLDELSSAIDRFQCSKKPIGTIASAGLLAASVFNGVKITMGKEIPQDMIVHRAFELAVRLGARHEEKDTLGVTHCEKYNVYSTPGTMDNVVTYDVVHDGIGELVKRMLMNTDQNNNIINSPAR